MPLQLRLCRRQRFPFLRRPAARRRHAREIWTQRSFLCQPSPQPSRRDDWRGRQQLWWRARCARCRSDRSDCRQSFTRSDTVCLTHLHRSEASLGFVLRLNCEQNPRATLRLHRRASSYTVGCASASCGTASPHRCAATFGIAARERCGQYRYCTRCTLLHPLRKPLRERRVEDASAARRRSAATSVAAAPTTAIYCVLARACVVGRDGGQQAPEAARDAQSIGAEG